MLSVLPGKYGAIPLSEDWVSAVHIVRLRTASNADEMLERSIRLRTAGIWCT